MYSMAKRKAPRHDKIHMKYFNGVGYLLNDMQKN